MIPVPESESEGERERERARERERERERESERERERERVSERERERERGRKWGREYEKFVHKSSQYNFIQMLKVISQWIFSLLCLTSFAHVSHFPSSAALIFTIYLKSLGNIKLILKQHQRSIAAQYYFINSLPLASSISQRGYTIVHLQKNSTVCHIYFFSLPLHKTYGRTVSVHISL